MIAVGVPVGIIAVICAGVLWGKFCRKHIYAELPSNLREIADTGEGKKLPPFGTVLGIILIPLVLILLNSVTDYLSLPAAVKSVFEFLGTSFVSLIIATLCAMFFLGKKQGYSGDDLKKILDRALKPMVQYTDLMKISEEETIAFYEKLGFSVALRTYNEEAGEAVAFLQLGNLMLEIYENHQAPMQAGAWDHLAIDVKDIEAAYEEICALGLNNQKDTIHFLPFWENGVKFFKITGTNCEVIEFSQIL